MRCPSGAVPQAGGDAGDFALSHLSGTGSGQLLLLSSSRVYDRPYLEHARDAILAFLDGVTTLHFLPWALSNHAEYTNRVAAVFKPLGITIVGMHASAQPRDMLASAHAVCVGGGNTFRLLDALYRYDLLELMYERVRTGKLRYLGWSAGTNVAAPTIRTTNDMPIVEPPSLAALGLVPFQINPHYVDPDPNSTHMGETRAQRLEQYLEENERPVVGLYEGAWLHVRNGTIVLGGASPGGMLFARNAPPQRLETGSAVTIEPSPYSG